VLSSPARSERALQYGPIDGLPELAAVLAAAPSVQARAQRDTDEIVVTTGSQQAVHLLASVLIDDGDAVVVRRPVLPRCAPGVARAGAQLVGVPVDTDGLRVDVLAERLRAGSATALRLHGPAFQNPSGRGALRGARAELVQLARRYGFLVIEDDAYGALGFEARRPSRSHRRADWWRRSHRVEGARAGVARRVVRAPEPARAAVVRASRRPICTPPRSPGDRGRGFADGAFLADHLVLVRVVTRPARPPSPRARGRGRDVQPRREVGCSSGHTCAMWRQLPCSTARWQPI